MIHDSTWFEMSDGRKPRLATASWIPLFARQCSSEKKYAEPGHWEEYFGTAAIVFPEEDEVLARQVQWIDVNQTTHRPSIEGGEYLPASRFVDWNLDVQGDFLVLLNHFETGEPIIDPDLILGLRLMREGDSWLAPHEDYVPVIRLEKDSAGRVVLVEIRGEHLKDYLSARNCGLMVSTFRSRREVSEEIPQFEMPANWEGENAYWEGGISEIDAEGGQYGASVGVLLMGRTDIDPNDDVPIMDFPGEGSTWSSNKKFQRLGPKRYLAMGEMWRNEWVAPTGKSPRVRGDREESNVEFIVDNNGKRLGASELVRPPSRWLWFSPAVINELLFHRGTKLVWYSENIAGLAIPSEGIIHFGINEAELVNVYAKDIAELQVLWQKLWVA